MMSVCTSVAQDLGNHWTDWILLFRVYTYWSCGGFELFSLGVGHPQPSKNEKIPPIFFNYLKLVVEWGLLHRYLIF